MVDSEVGNEIRQEGFTAQISVGDTVYDPSRVRGHSGISMAIIGTTGTSDKFSDRQTFA